MTGWDRSTVSNNWPVQPLISASKRLRASRLCPFPLSGLHPPESQWYWMLLATPLVWVSFNPFCAFHKLYQSVKRPCTPCNGEDAIHSKPLAKTLFHSPAVSSPNPLIWILHLSWYIPLRTDALSWGVSVRSCKEGSQPSFQCCLTHHHTSLPHPAQGILPISGSLGGDPSICESQRLWFDDKGSTTNKPRARV